MITNTQTISTTSNKVTITRAQSPELIGPAKNHHSPVTARNGKMTSAAASRKAAESVSESVTGGR